MTDTNVQSTRPRRRRPLLWLTLIALVAAGWFGWQHFFAANAKQTELPTAEVQRGDIEEVVTATGTLQPRDYVDVGAQVSGQLTRIHVQVGDVVHQGDLLAEIDAVVLQSRVDATRASLRSQRAQLKDRDATLRLARIQLRRQRNLIVDEATTLDEVQKAEASVDSAEAQIEMLRAQIEQTESNLRADSANLEYTRIEAPMAGTVVSITARQGQTLNTNQQTPTLLRIADLGTMTVETQVSEADVPRIRPGMEAYFTTLGGEGKRWQGTLAKIEPTPTVTNNVVLYKALFDVPNDDGRLMPQMTAQVFFITAAARDALLIPMSAVVTRDRGSRAGGSGANMPTRPPGGAPGGDNGQPRQRGLPGTVQVVRADGSVESRDIRYGVTNRIQAEIVAGLEAGEKVVSGARPSTRATGGGANVGMPRMPPRI